MNKQNKTEMDSETENKLVVARRDRSGGMNNIGERDEAHCVNTMHNHLSGCAAVRSANAQEA